MSRLTDKERNFDGTASSKESLIDKNNMPSDYCSKILTKLADYEDKQEQGLLIELPCKVGDTVYFTDRRYDRENRTFIPFVHHGYVKAIKFSARPTKLTIEYEDLDDRCGRCKGHDIHASNIGKTVFLTRSEAEEALAKMGGK